jgi:hypothetical protein
MRTFSCCFFTIVFCALLFGLGFSQNTLPLDEHFTLSYQDYPQPNVAYKEIYANLASGDRISINITVTGQPLEFDIIGSGNEYLLTKNDVDSVNEEWTAPRNDTYNLYFLHKGGSLTGNSQVHFTAQKLGEGQGGGGFDPTPIVIIVIILLVVLVSVFFIFRLRKQPPPPPPP